MKKSKESTTKKSNLTIQSLSLAEKIQYNM